MTEEELNKQEQKQSQSEIIGAIRDVDLAIDRIRESFALIFGLLEDRAHEWIDNYEAVQPSSSENHDAKNSTSLKGEASLASGARSHTVRDRGKWR
jgi:hypothetical protein